MIVTPIILSIVFAVFAHVLSIVSGYAKMVCDLSEEEKLNFVPKEYWHKRISSVNKHKYTGKVKAWLMKNLLVMFTDGWHLFNLLFRVSFATLYTLLGLLISTSLWYLFGCLVAYIIFATSFHIFHTYKILRK
mgnify:CR=1 FL=1